MRPAVSEELIRRLTSDFSFVQAQGFLRKGRCPSCEKKELYAKADAPWLVRCGRLNKCGYESHVKELYPDVFADFNRRYRATKENPQATADAYMAMARGFDLARCRAWYEQGRFWHPDGDKGTATVRFWVDRPGGVYMERLVEDVCVADADTGERNERKAHFKGSHRGLWWAPPGLKIEDEDTVWIVEGCLDAIALAHHGVKAVAVLSCVNYPDRALAAVKAADVNWVWALDNDKAGRGWTLKHLQRMREAGLTGAAAQSHEDDLGAKQDWNDLHLRDALEARDLDRYRYFGDLLTARYPSEKALRMYEETEKQRFPFVFRNRLFFFDLNVEKFDKAVLDLEEAAGSAGMTERDIRLTALAQAGGVKEIANCNPRALYFMSNRLTDESWYFFRVFFPHEAAAVNDRFTGPQLASASEFKKRLLSVASGALFTGSSQQLDTLLRQQIHGLKTVETVDFIGYSREFKAYVFSDVCVRDGKLYRATEEDYFQTPKLAVRSLNQSVVLHINPNLGELCEEWVEHLWVAFGERGIAGLAYWLGGLFAEQIRAQHKSFPFLEIVGDAGAGKTTLIEFLWKLCGRVDYEGFDPSKSTLAGRARNFAQVANLPVVLIEADRDEDAAHARRFDWEELKTAYNGRSVRSRGLKNSGNETYEPPFRGALVISQNAEVSASEAILSRIVHLHFTRADHGRQSRAAAEALEQMPVERVSGFCLRAILAEKKSLETIGRTHAQFERAIFSLPGVNTPRIAKNHAQMIGFLYALSEIVTLPDGALEKTCEFLEESAVARQRAINADHPMVEQFWELYDYLDGDEKLNHSMNGSVAVNLNHMAEMAEKRRLSLPPIAELKRHLRGSKHPKFAAIKTVKSDLLRHQGEWEGKGDSKAVKCWVFDRK